MALPPTATPPSMPLPTLTLIVAATTPSMGIGLRGTLPWTGLKREMAYFARVTKRPPAAATTHNSTSTTTTTTTTTNAVIMGRKTWESIPPRFRPLKGRTNVVVSRSPQDLGLGAELGVLGVGSIREGLEALQKGDAGVGRVFVIGGAEIYRVAVRMEECRRILLTRIRSEFECDTFFPVELGGRGEGGWVRRGREELDGWVGEEVPRGAQVEGGVEYEFEMWEREGGG